MKWLKNDVSIQLNPRIWRVLELVRLRQTPWHKKQATFEKLLSLGLVEAIPQKTLTPSAFPAPIIAVLTDSGRRVLDARMNQQAVIEKHLNS